MSNSPEIVVIGGGAAGLTAARHASRLGASVTLVAHGPLGGDCTHTGCIPSKTLIARAANGSTFSDAMAAARDAVDRVAATEDEAAMARVGVRVVRGRATLGAANRVHVADTTLRADHVIVATGARPALPPIAGLEQAGVHTSETIFALDTPPDRLVVIGAGAIGCELAQAFARLGTSVHLVEATERILPAEDPRASAVVHAALVADGVEIHTGEGIEHVTGPTGGPSAAGERRVDLTGTDRLECDAVLVTTGRRPVTDGLGLDRIGVATDASGHILVDDTCETSVRHVWAVGDVTDAGGFTHVAGHMGYVAATNSARTARMKQRARIDRVVVPRVTFTDPEVAHVGMSEAEVAHVGGRVATMALQHFDRAITEGRTEGFVTLFVGPRRVLGNLGGGRVLGATIVAPRAGELLAEVALAMRTRAFAGRLAQTTHAYPTWSAAIQQVASGLFFTSSGVEVRDAQG